MEEIVLAAILVIAVAILAIVAAVNPVILVFDLMYIFQDATLKYPV